MLKIKSVFIVIFGLVPFTALSEQFHTNLVQIPIIAEKTSEWAAMMSSPLGGPFTMKQTGFVSAESGFTTDQEGNVTFTAWVKWETKEDFINYISTPERAEGSKFHTTMMSVLAGQPSVLWIE